MAVSKAEVNAFNRDFDMYEMWRDGVTENIKPPKVKPYYFYTNAPNEPVWFKNLQKAWTSTRRRKALTEAVIQRNSGISIPSIEEVREDPNAWQKYCDSREIKRPVGRPKLPPEQRKSQKGKVKRSDLMRQLLSDHGITINEDNGFEPATDYEGWIFLPNGRVQFEEEPSISVHGFLRDFK